MKQQATFVFVVTFVCVVTSWASADMSGGSIISWGWDSHGQISHAPTGSGFIDIAAGEFTSHALISDGSIVSWGWDSHGQISHAPTGSGFIDIAAGEFTSHALISDGSIVSWGWDSHGQISHAPTGSGFIDIAAGEFTSHALTPVPGATLLGIIGLSFSGWLLKRKRMI
ncbi:MAG: hypothetical protein H8D56_25535 [Planctomycetes bacterium]|nr:hypothetical protein [Planctomycetota bacterium]